MNYFIYDKKKKPITDDEIDAKIVIIDLITEIKDNKNMNNTNKGNMNRKRENFELDEDELRDYNQKMEILDKNLDLLLNKKAITNNMLELYKRQYKLFIEKGNALSFKEYMKYISPEKNIFYDQYL